MQHMTKARTPGPASGALKGNDPNCALCTAQSGVPVWGDAHWRVIRVEDAAFPAYYRVIANRHTVEFTDLSALQRQRCMSLVCSVERVLRDLLRPTKINLAALGNSVPHLHWHVIARFDWDSHYPQSVWGERQREPSHEPTGRLLMALPLLDKAVAQALVAVS
jgi:diadenosine tetraphosphate (Ap4A) HIT family hydrolase